ncbi:hypothetical protein, partial [Salmonella enterica]|uniref:hypothetical protein n=1 Tax=Salmonella enterica TaxID=28901 RepID=UPI000796EB4C
MVNTGVDWILFFFFKIAVKIIFLIFFFDLFFCFFGYCGVFLLFGLGVLLLSSVDIEGWAYSVVREQFT